MNSAGQGCIVDKAHHRLPTFFNHKGWARGNSVIPNENRLVLVRVNLLSELVDVDLIIVNESTGDGICNSPIPRQHRFLAEY